MRDRKRQENQQRLAEAGLGLFLAEGTTAVTIDQIVDAAGMAKGSFYRYARDKADLVELIMAPVVSELTVALDRCDLALRGARRDQLAAIYAQLATELSLIVSRYAPHARLYLQEVRAPAGPPRRAIHALSEQLTARAVALTEIARDHGLIRDVAPEISALTVLGAVEAILFTYLGRRMASRPVPIVIAELVGIVLRGIGR